MSASIEPLAPSRSWPTLPGWGWGLAALLLGLLSLRAAGYDNEGDLRVYYDVVGRVPQGLDLYQLREGPDPERPTGYIYPPLFALAFLPLTALPFPWVRGLWFFLMGLLAVRSVLVGLGLASARGLGRGWVERAGLALGLACALRFVWSDLGHGQVNVLVAWLAIEGIAQAERGRDRRAGALLALATLVKLTPALLIAGYLVAGRWRLAAWAGAVGMAGLAAPALVFGPALTLDQLLRFGLEVTPWNAQAHAYVGNNAALTSLVQRLLVGVADPGQTPRPLLASLDPAAVRRACTALSGAVLLATLVASTRLRGVRRPALLLAAVPLISPVAWKPHLAGLLLPLLVAGRALSVPGPGRWLAGAGAALLLVSGRGFVGRWAADQASVWGITTLGLVLLAAGLARRPSAEGPAAEGALPDSGVAPAGALDPGDARADPLE